MSYYIIATWQKTDLDYAGVSIKQRFINLLYIYTGGSKMKMYLLSLSPKWHFKNKVLIITSGLFIQKKYTAGNKWIKNVISIYLISWNKVDEIF